MNKLLASASALAICLSSSLGATETNEWFKVDFEATDGYTANAVIAGVSQTGGAWSKAGADASTMTNMAVKGEVGKLDTQGDQLTWTPTAASTQDVVLIDTDVYLVGSDEAPTTVTTGVQTEVYLKNVLDGNGQVVSSVLCAHVYDTVGSSNAWVELDGVTVSHQSWVKLRIEMNYGGASPMVSFWVNDILMEKVGSSTSSFRVMDATKTAVNSVSFMGTGYIDNFIGSQVEDIVSGPTFDPPQVSTNGVTAFAGGSIDTSTPNKVIATFADTLGGETLQYVQLTGPNGYVRTYRTSNGAAVEFDTTGLASGNYDVTAYYGAAPTVVPVGYKPAAEAGGAKPAAEVVEVGEAKFLRVNVKPVSGLYYTLFVGTDGALPADLSAAAASVLAYPHDQDGETLVIDLPVPTDPNGVNLIKIYASDEAYKAEDPAPAP